SRFGFLIARWLTRQSPCRVGNLDSPAGVKLSPTIVCRGIPSSGQTGTARAMAGRGRAVHRYPTQSSNEAGPNPPTVSRPRLPEAFPALPLRSSLRLAYAGTMTRKASFAPVAAPHTRLLILGSLP